MGTEGSSTLNRREASVTIGLGILGAAAASMQSNAANPGTAVGKAGAAVGASDRKKWSRQNFRGMESFIMPSFTPDLEGLDEEGIRNDVRHGIRQGFGALFSIPLGLKPAESRRLLEIMADEAHGKVIIGGTSDVLALDQSVAEFKHAESVGVSETLLGFRPKVADRGRDLQQNEIDDYIDKSLELSFTLRQTRRFASSMRPAFR